MLKEHKINKLNNFINGWYIDKNVCKDLIKFFKLNKDKAEIGKLTDGVNKNIKKSTDLGVFFNAPALEIQNYNKELLRCTQEYIKIYPALKDSLNKWGIVESYNIQKYKKKEAYFGWHTERTTGKEIFGKRLLVFMTYLNDVKDGGQTEWFHQKLKIKPETGLTVIWPADWMFLHRGIVTKKEEKFIITGWFSFIE
jgi:hypothetical protein